MEQRCKNQQLNDELSLFDLIHIAWQQKWFVLSIILASVGCSLTYLHFTKPLYEARMTISAPHLRDIAFLNPGQFASGTAKQKTFNIGEIYSIFADSFQSETIKERFFKEVFLPSLSQEQKESMSEQQLFALFLKELVIKKLPNTARSTFDLIVKTEDLNTSRAWVKEYLEMANNNALTELKNSIKLHNIALAKEINLLKAAENHNKVERMNEFQETLSAIKAAGLQSVAVNLPPTSELQVLQNKYDFYNTLQLSTNDIKMFRNDGPLISSPSPIHPKVNIVLILGLLMGLVFGFSGGLLRHNLGRRVIKIN